MSDIKCPFCGKHIRYLGTDLFTCDTCHIMLPAKHWIAYINTRKALDVAVDALKEIKYIGSWAYVGGLATVFTEPEIAQQALDRIKKITKTKE